MRRFRFQVRCRKTQAHRKFKAECPAKVLKCVLTHTKKVWSNEVTSNLRYESLSSFNAMEVVL